MNVLTGVAVVIVLAALTELLIEAVKPGLDPLFKRLPIPDDVEPYFYVSLVLGIALCLLFHADLLTAIGLESPYLSAIWFQRGATGVLVGRGANFIHDAIERLSKPGTITVETTPLEGVEESTTKITIESEQGVEHVDA